MMREVTVQAFEAFDKTSHPTAEACRDYEKRRMGELVVADPGFAEMVEALGMIVRRDRQSRGELRRASPKKAAPERRAAE
jgi:hypothetical protein